MTTIKLLLPLFLLATSCAPISEMEWKQKKMLKADRKMIRKVKYARKFSK